MALPKFLLIVSEYLTLSRVLCADNAFLCLCPSVHVSSTLPSSVAPFSSHFLPRSPPFSVEVPLTLPVLASCRECRYAHS